MTVTTKTKESPAAYRAHYDNGRLAPAKPGQSAEPKAVAGRPGTQITVEDLFYNVPTRRRAFRSASDEYNKIIDMVGRYAIHCAGVAFSCKKHGEASTSISVQAAATVSDRIRQIYGGNVASELIEYEVSNDKWAFKAQGWATNANYNIKKTTLLLFINHRCVESTNIRRAIEQTYSAFLPKNGHPFVYLSLEIDPSRVDVNVHPTKKEVNFLNEDEIIQTVCEHIRTKLAAVDTSRTFMTQTLLPGGMQNSPDSRRTASDSSITPASAGAKKTPRPYENNLVRTDTNLRKITSMFTRAAGTPYPEGRSGSASNTNGPVIDSSLRPQKGPLEPISYETSDAQYKPCKLSSVHALRAEVREDMHHELTDIFANHTFVGIVDERRRLVAMQGGVKLYLVDYGRVCFEYLYQIGLTDFGNFGTIVFSPPLDLRELLQIAAEGELEAASSSPSSASHAKDKASDELEQELEEAASQLIAVREMILEYFSLEIKPTGDLVSIPLLVKGYQPALFKLPSFLLNLTRKVPWDAEKPCFEAFLRELATFYVPEQLPPPIASSGADSTQTADNDDADSSDVEKRGVSTIEARREHVRWAVEHIFFPAFKARLVGTRGLLQNGGLTEVSDLKVMYRVFERC